MSRRAVISLALLMSPAITATGQPEPLYKAQSTDSNHQHPQGPLDYALGKINTSNQNYGQKLETARRVVVANTLADFYFWSNCLSLILLIGETGFFLFHLRSAERKERIVATLIAQLWNGRVSDKVEIDSRTAEHNQLVDKYNEIVEKALSLAPAPRRKKPTEENMPHEQPRVEVQPVELPLHAAGSQALAGVQVMTEKNSPISAVDRNFVKPDKGTSQSSQVEPDTNRDKHDPKREQEVILLRNQLAAMQNTVKNLQTRLNAQTEFLDQTQPMRSIGSKT